MTAADRACNEFFDKFYFSVTWYSGNGYARIPRKHQNCSNKRSVHCKNQMSSHSNAVQLTYHSLKPCYFIARIDFVHRRVVMCSLWFRPIILWYFLFQKPHIVISETVFSGDMNDCFQYIDGVFGNLSTELMLRLKFSFQHINDDIMNSLYAEGYVEHYWCKFQMN